MNSINDFFQYKLWMRKKNLTSIACKEKILKITTGTLNVACLRNGHPQFESVAMVTVLWTINLGKVSFVIQTVYLHFSDIFLLLFSPLFNILFLLT